MPQLDLQYLAYLQTRENIENIDAQEAHARRNEMWWESYLPEMEYLLVRVRVSSATTLDDSGAEEIPRS